MGFPVKKDRAVKKVQKVIPDRLANVGGREIEAIRVNRAFLA